MATSNILSDEDKEFLAKCEEELKHRYTENDEEFMKVFNAEPSQPPIVESWWVPNVSRRRNDRRHFRGNHPYERYGNRNRDHHNRSGYGEYGRRYDNRGQEHYDRRPR